MHDACLIYYIYTLHICLHTYVHEYMYIYIDVSTCMPHTPTHPHTHTCSEQSLRILMWNASYVQETLQLHLTGMGRWNDPRNIEKVSSPCPVLEEISWQIATTVQRNRKNRNQLFDMPVLGLAGCHCSEKCRYVDKRPHRYHRQQMSVFVSAGLISAPDTPCWKTK